MRRGDIVKLRQPHQILTVSIEVYTHGIIAARIKAESQAKANPQSNAKPAVKELIVYLYNPESAKLSIDEEGVPVLFDFHLNEVELFKAVKEVEWL